MPISRPIIELINEVSHAASVPEMDVIFGTATVAGPKDETVRRLKSAVAESITTLNREFNWQEQVRLAEFTLAPGDTAVPYPDDFDRLEPGTMHRKDMWGRVHLGPATATEWRQAQFPLASGINIRWRFAADRIMIEPGPATADTMQFEYVSKHAVIDANGYFQPRVKRDDDRLAMDEHLTKLDLKWRILREFGEAFADEKQECIDALHLRFSQQTGGGPVCYGSGNQYNVAGYTESNTVILG